MPDTDARRLLAALARDGTCKSGPARPDRDHVAYGSLIDRATAATEDLASATAFLADHDLDELEAAVEQAERDLSEQGRAGRRAHETLKRFSHAAAGQSPQSDPTPEK